MSLKPNSIRVLVIDDDPADQELARLALAKAERGRFQCEFSNSLTAAAEQLRNNQFDVALLDLGLPECSGLKTIEKVRDIDDAIPIVVLSDLTDAEAAMKCLDFGAQDFINKSQLALDTLVRAIRNAIHRQQLLDELGLANDELARKNDDLARLCDTAQRFVDNVSHEFRTPLTVINEYVSLLLEGVVGDSPLDTDQKRSLGVVLDRCNDLNTMVDDMLDVSKLEAGLLKAWRKNCRVEDIVEHVRPSLEAKASIKDVVLEFQVASGLPLVYCDAEKVGRVLINLAVNAIKFCGDPGRVRVLVDQGDDHEVRFSVMDNGPGISEADRRVIFERFQQLNATIRSAQKGFGLGLGIAKELVDLNLGQMAVESELGKGSIFSFTVPAANPSVVTCRYFRLMERTQPAVGGHIGVIEVGVSESDDPDGVESFLHFMAGAEDLVFQAAERQWLVVSPLKTDKDCDAMIDRARGLREDHNRNRPGKSLPEIQFRTVCENSASELNVVVEAISTLFDEEPAYV